MFCPKCGSEVKDGDMFCGECGMRMEPLESENQQTESQKTADQNETQKSKPVQPNQAPNKAPAKSGGLFKGFSSKAKKIVIAEVAVLVVLIAAFFYIGNSKSSPEAAANQFVKDYNNKKWSNIYDKFNLSEDTFINEEAFEKTMDQNETKTLSTPTGGYVNYGTYAGQYVYQAKKGSDEVEIHIAKSAKKNFLFFDKYEVTSATDTGLATESVKLFTMPGVTLKIDGIAAKVPEDTSENTYNVTMFAGKHKLTFSGADGLFDQDSYTFNTNDDNPLNVVQYSGTAKTEAAKALKSYMPEITEAKIKDKGNAGITSYFTSTEAAENYGVRLCDSIWYYGSDAKSLGSVKLTKCQATSSDSSYNTVADGVFVAVSGSRDYKYKIWDRYETQTLKISGVARMIRKNGKWLIDTASYY